LQVGAGSAGVTGAPALGANDVLITGNLEVNGSIYSNGILSTSSKFLLADVSMPSANTFYDGPNNLTLNSGTYILSGNVLGTNASEGQVYTAKLWDGSTVYASCQVVGGTSGRGNFLTFPGVVVTVSSGTKTFKISVATTDTNAIIRATPTYNNSGTTNTASYILAVRIK